MITRKKYYPLIESILNSYAQVFFSTNKIFGLLLLTATFLDYFAGLSGFLAVIISNALGYLAGYRRYYLQQGYYGFNSLLVGIGLGVFYDPSPAYFLVLASATFLTFFITVTMEGVIGKYGLPYLSIPFLFGLWLTALATRQYSELEISERGLFALNEMYSLGGLTMVRVYEWFGDLNLPKPVVVYFRSLGAIFFQYHLLPGILIAAGLLVHSRIAFSLSILGFASAYLFYNLVGADLSELNYAYIGFNFILTAVAVGGFFTVPSPYSYLWVILLIPLISIVLTATNTLFATFQLSIYSLPFNVIVLVFIYSLKFRERLISKPELTGYQHFSPEKNVYYHRNFRYRFGETQRLPFALPFWGEWTVTQGHRGDITHKESWAEAWDFEIFDQEGKKYKGSGNSRNDYYCYDKPVVAAADGWVEKVEDSLEDNPIGSVDLRNNWGNTIVIKHAEKLYSAVSHLKKGSAKVRPGEYVRRGQVIGSCGNSGRSPVPHLHFQVQDTPEIGSATVSYPFSRYVINENGSYSFGFFGIPEKDQEISNININQSLKQAFHLVPGQQLNFSVTQGSKQKEVTWDIASDMSNNTYIKCRETGARAYFTNDEDLIYFTFYSGSRDNLLYYFYLAAYKVAFGYYPEMKIEDRYPLPSFAPKWVTWWNDFIAPFYNPLSARFTLKYAGMKGLFSRQEITLESFAEYHSRGRIKKNLLIKTKISGDKIRQIEVIRGDMIILSAECQEDQ